MKKRTRKQAVRMEQFDEIDDPLFFSLRKIASAMIGSRNSIGHVRQDVIIKHLKTLSDVIVKNEETVELSDAVRSQYKISRKSHDVDIWVEHPDYIELFNSKSRGASRTDDPSLTVQTYLAVRQQVESDSGKPTTYSVLRIGGDEKSEPEFEKVGVHTYETSEWVSKRCGYAINIEKETELEEKGKCIKQLYALDEGTRNDVLHYRPLIDLVFKHCSTSNDIKVCVQTLQINPSLYNTK